MGCRRAAPVAVAALAATAAALMTAAPARAHVHLTGSVPRDGAHVRGPVDSVRLDFNGAVEQRFASARLFDAAGRAQSLGRPRRISAGRLVVGLPPETPRGAIVISYRVLSTDGHPVVGALTFDTAVAAGARQRGPAARSSPAGAVAVAAGARAGPRAHSGGARSVLAGARWLQYVAIAVALGGTAFLALVWLPALRHTHAAPGRAAAAAALTRRWRIVAMAATVTGGVSALAALAGQAALARGDGAVRFFDALGAVLSTRVGAAWAIAALAWLAVGAILAAAGRRADHPRILMALGLPLAVLAVVPAASGHAGRGGVLIAANVAHVVAVSAWLGGLLALMLAARAAGGAALAPLRGDVVVRFSIVALVAMAVLTVSGGLQSALLLDAPGELVTSGYGRLLLVKIAITLLLLGLGVRQRARVAACAEGRRDGDGQASAAVASVRLEALLGLLVLATTALLAGEIARG